MQISSRGDTSSADWDLTINAFGFTASRGDLLMDRGVFTLIVLASPSVFEFISHFGDTNRYQYADDSLFSVSEACD